MMDEWCLKRCTLFTPSNWQICSLESYWISYEITTSKWFRLGVAKTYSVALWWSAKTLPTSYSPLPSVKIYQTLLLIQQNIDNWILLKSGGETTRNTRERGANSTPSDRYGQYEWITMLQRVPVSDQYFSLSLREIPLYSRECPPNNYIDLLGKTQHPIQNNVYSKGVVLAKFIKE